MLPRLSSKVVKATILVQCGHLPIAVDRRDRRSRRRHWTLVVMASEFLLLGSPSLLSAKMCA